MEEKRDKKSQFCPNPAAESLQTINRNRQVHRELGAHPICQPAQILNAKPGDEDK